MVPSLSRAHSLLSNTALGPLKTQAFDGDGFTEHSYGAPPPLWHSACVSERLKLLMTSPPRNLSDKQVSFPKCIPNLSALLFPGSRSDSAGQQRGTRSYMKQSMCRIWTMTSITSSSQFQFHSETEHSLPPSWKGGHVNGACGLRIRGKKLESIGQRHEYARTLHTRLLVYGLG